MYDGVCNICNVGTRIVSQLDKGGTIYFVAMQSKAAVPFLQAAGLTPEDIDREFAFFEHKPVNKTGTQPCQRELANSAGGVAGGEWAVSRGGQAALRVGVACETVPISAAASAALAVTPARLADIIYDVVAKNRYQWFGRTDVCQVPPPAIRARFLDWGEGA